MLSQAVLGISFAIQLLVLGILTWGVCEYIRLRHQLCHIKRRIVTMNIDEVIDELLEADNTDTDTKYHHHAVAKQTEHQAGPETTHSVGGEAFGYATTVVQQHRERLAALAAGGRADNISGRHCPLTRSIIRRKKRLGSSTAATRLGLGQQWQKPWVRLRSSSIPLRSACFCQYPPRSSQSCSQNLSLILTLSMRSAMLRASSITSLEWYLPR